MRCVVGTGIGFHRDLLQCSLTLLPYAVSELIKKRDTLCLARPPHSTQIDETTPLNVQPAAGATCEVEMIFRAGAL
jgi:hypothetical protein